MRHLLKHKVTWLTRIFFILVSFFAFQIHVIPILANSIDVGQKHHVGIAGSELVPDPGNPAAYPSTWASADIDPFRPVPDYSSNVFTTILQVAPFTSDVIDIVNTVKAIGEGKWGDAVWSGIFLLPYSDAAKLPKLVNKKAAVGVGANKTVGAADEAFHYTAARWGDAIKKEGLRPGSYAAPAGNLSPLQAKLELALPPTRAAPEIKIRIDLDGLRKAGYEVPTPSRVSSTVRGPDGRVYQMPGGGYEIQFPYKIPGEFLEVLPIK